jgi:hypothetical protein
MTTNHTPGPWHADPLTSTSRNSYVFSKSGYVVAEVPLDRNYKKAADANARLMAAAPDMAEALERIYDYCVSQPGTNAAFLASVAGDALRKAKPQ